MSPLMLHLSQVTVPGTFFSNVPSFEVEPELGERYIPFEFKPEMRNPFHKKIIKLAEQQTGIRLPANRYEDLEPIITLYISETHLFLAWWAEFIDWDNKNIEYGEYGPYDHSSLPPAFRTKDYPLTIRGFWQAKLEMQEKFTLLIENGEFFYSDGDSPVEGGEVLDWRSSKLPAPSVA